MSTLLIHYRPRMRPNGIRCGATRLGVAVELLAFIEENCICRDVFQVAHERADRLLIY